MRNILILLFSCLVIAATAQERSVNLAGTNTLVDLSVSKYISYNGTTLDRLIPTTRDTIDYYVILRDAPATPQHFYARILLDTIAGADTTVAITVQEKKFAGETYSDIIASALTSAVGAEVAVVKTSLGVTTEYTQTIAAATDIISQITATNTDTVTVAARTVTMTANTLLRYKYLKFRLILQGNDLTGTGVKVKRIELQFF